MSRNPQDTYHPQQTVRIVQTARALRLSVEEYGVYRFIIDLMWIEGGPIPNRPRSLAADLDMTVRTWNRVVAKLTERGLLIVGEHVISDFATMDAINANRAFSAERAASGRKGGEARARNRAVQADLVPQHQRGVRRETISRAVPENSAFPRGNVKENNGGALAQLQAEPQAQLLAIENRDKPSCTEPVPAEDASNDRGADPPAPDRAKVAWLSEDAQAGLAHVRAAMSGARAPALPLPPVLVASNPNAPAGEHTDTDLRRQA